jgi:ParB family chromosome partitioning protein
MAKRGPDIPEDFFGGEEALDRLVGSRRGANLVNARIEDIDPNPYNPRQFVDVSELVESMREHGFMGALDGRLVGDRVQLAYGARRLAAAQEAGITHIPVYIHANWDEETLLTVSLVENVQREDLTPVEAAQMVLRMNQDLGWSQEEIARRTGKSRTWVRDLLALADAPAEVKALVQERPEAIRHARYISAVEDEAARRELARATREEGLSQPQVYRAIQALQQGAGVDQALAEARRPTPRPEPVPPWTPPAPPAAGGAPAAVPEAPSPTAAAQPEPQPAARPGGAPPEGQLAAAGGEAPGAGGRPQVRTRPSVQALLWAIYGRLERVSLAEVREEAADEPAALWSVIRAIHRALDNVIAQLPPEEEEPPPPGSAG